MFSSNFSCPSLASSAVVLGVSVSPQLSSSRTVVVLLYCGTLGLLSLFQVASLACFRIVAV